MTNLGNRMAKGAVWLVLFRLIDRSIAFVSTLILARVLVPADFGLVAMASSILAALELLSSFSFDLALIQNQRAERRHYDTAWSFSVLFGVCNALAMCVLAIPAATFFGEPRVESLMYVLALSPLIQGFDNVGIVAFQKDLEFHKEFWFGLTRKLVGFTLTITLALYLQSYWALVAGTLAMRITSLLLSYRLHSYRPRFSLAAAGELFNFSKWLLFNNILIFINNRGTDFMIGHISGARALGLYSVSYEIANLPTTELVWPITRAVFPGYARMSGDRDLLRRSFLQVLSLMALISIPAGAGIGLIAGPLVDLLLGPKWVDTKPLIEILALFGIVRAVHGPTGAVFVALGKPRLVAVFQAVQISVAIVVMTVLVPRYGVVGAAWSLLGAAIFAALANYTMVMRELTMTLGQVVNALWRPTIAVATMGVLLRTLDFFLSAVADFVAVRLLCMIIVGGVAYILTIAACWFMVGRPDGPEALVLSVLRARLSRRFLGRNARPEIGAQDK